MTRTELAEYKVKQFNLKLEQMSDVLAHTPVSEADKQKIMTYYRWLCFDGVLKEGLKPTEHMIQMEKEHWDYFDGALANGLKRVKPAKRADIRSKAVSFLSVRVRD